MEELRRHAETDERWFLRGVLVIAVVVMIAGIGKLAGPVVTAFLAPLFG
ncbi:MAG: hypothetical protein AB7K36_05560 [Chloroflexota bacterium]